MAASEILRIARKEEGLTQRELAEIAGVPQSTIARIESGAIQPRFDTLSRLLGKTHHYLVLERDPSLGVDRSLIREMLQLTPRQRIESAALGGRTIDPLRKARRKAVLRSEIERRG